MTKRKIKMNLDLEGVLDMCRYKPITFIRHNGRSVSDEEARTIINYGISAGYETLADIPDDVAEDILSHPGKYKEHNPGYIPYIAVERVRDVLQEWRNDLVMSDDDTIDDLIDDIISSL